MVYREFLTGALYLDRESEVAAYEEVWAIAVFKCLTPVVIFNKVTASVTAGTGQILN
ncbi:hypothetical protein AB0F49_25565 [Micromonospora ureilytica]|uniref:hypothetical protein n=1 Tax=Micromonospora ureilytica TaxID=709868 RepID=UPI0033DC6832